MSGVLHVVGDRLVGLVALDATYTANDGVLSLNNDGTLSAPGYSGATWVTPNGVSIASQYECRASALSGNVAQFVGTSGSWLALSSTRSWSVNAGGYAVTFTLEIRDRSTQIVRDTASVTVSTS